MSKQLITFSSKGDFNSITKFLKELTNRSYVSIFEKYGKKGVEALSQATPKKTGKTAASWNYRIQNDPGFVRIDWYNTNVSPTNEHVNIALILQYGHGTKNGGYVQGIDYINPAMKPIFDEILNEVWSEVVEE